jgi:hypothetical protein
LSFQLRGLVDAPLVGTSSRDYHLAPTLRGKLVLATAAQLRLFADTSFTWMFQRTSIALAGEPIGSFGPWLVTAGLGAEIVMGN